MVGPLQVNCYVIWDEQTNTAAVIDPGGNCDDIVYVATSHRLEVKYVLLTHGHLDHTFCVGALAKEYGAEVAMHQDDIQMLPDELSLGQFYYDMSEYVDFAPSEMLSDGSVIMLGNSRISVIHTPGHSKGGLCFVTNAGVFCGDTIFAGGIGRTDFPGGSYTELISSIRSKILTLDDPTPLYPGHGPSTTVGAERSGNPYLA